eukprot:8200593-Ditylum_brightwellii.AAC.1
MQQRGAADIQQSTTYKTLVSIDFEVGKQEIAFPVCKKLAGLFNKIKGINDQVCLQESLGNKV